MTYGTTQGKIYVSLFFRLEGSKGPYEGSEGPSEGSGGSSERSKGLQGGSKKQRNGEMAKSTGAATQKRKRALAALHRIPGAKRHHMVSGTLAPLYTVFGLKLGCSGAAAPIGDKVL